ncbi:hypothetical protein GCM10028789_07000 [Sinomonas halotolerans]
MIGQIHAISGLIPARTARSVNAEKLRTKAPDPMMMVEAIPDATIGRESGLGAGAVFEGLTVPDYSFEMTCR